MRLLACSISALLCTGCAYGVRGGAMGIAHTAGPVSVEGTLDASLGIPFSNDGKEALSLVGAFSVGPAVTEKGPRESASMGAQYLRATAPWGLRSALLFGLRAGENNQDGNGTLLVSVGILRRLSTEYVREPGKLSGSHHHTSLSIDLLAGWAFPAGDSLSHDGGALLGLGLSIEYDRLDEFNLYFH